MAEIEELYKKLSQSSLKTDIQEGEVPLKVFLGRVAELGLTKDQFIEVVAEASDNAANKYTAEAETVDASIQKSGVTNQGGSGFEREKAVALQNLASRFRG